MTAYTNARRDESHNVWSTIVDMKGKDPAEFWTELYSISLPVFRANQLPALLSSLTLAEFYQLYSVHLYYLH